MTTAKTATIHDVMKLLQELHTLASPYRQVPRTEAEEARLLEIEEILESIPEEPR